MLQRHIMLTLIRSGIVGKEIPFLSEVIEEARESVEPSPVCREVSDAHARPYDALCDLQSGTVVASPDY